jgi:glycosyltransferase involved in cell wall biosynthesis
MERVLREAAIVCLPSYREGLPRVLLEAAATARAIVTTDAPGCRETVVPGLSGLIVPPRDARALEAALEALIADAATRARMGLAGRALVEREFSDEIVVAKTLAVYERLGVAPRG